jgi:hypothetical protein
MRIRQQQTTLGHRDGVVLLRPAVCEPKQYNGVHGHIERVSSNVNSAVLFTFHVGDDHKVHR